jgi:hypothetical protein
MEGMSSGGITEFSEALACVQDDCQARNRSGKVSGARGHGWNWQGSDGPRDGMQSASPMMFVNERKIAARDVARDFAVTAQAFADTFVQYIAADESDVDPEVLAHRRRETCAAVWAAILATFEVSGFTEAERNTVLPLIQETLMPFWQKHCGRADDLADVLAARAKHYLRERDPESQLKTATHIMTGVMEAIGPGAGRMLPVRTLTALLAHRMLTDLRRLGEIKASYSIE